jgi:hypothetical protein
MINILSNLGERSGWRPSESACLGELSVPFVAPLEADDQAFLRRLVLGGHSIFKNVRSNQTFSCQEMGKRL